MASTPFLYLYTTPQDPPNWRLGTQIYRAIGRFLEYLLEAAEVSTAVLMISVLCICIWKQKVLVLPLIGVVGLCLHEWALVFTFVLQVSFILFALGGVVNLVVWELFLKGVWRRVCLWRRVCDRERWDSGSSVGGVVLERVYGAVACWSFCHQVWMGIARLLEWVTGVWLWIAGLPELPKVYWKKWVSDSWVLVWARILIYHFGWKYHDAMEEDGAEDFETATCTPETAATATIQPVVIRSMHCTGSTSMDYVNPYPYPYSPPSGDLLLPESYPLPTAIVPHTPTTQQLCEEDPFMTPRVLRAGDPGFLDAYPSPEGGSKWQRGKKSNAEKEMERWRFPGNTRSKAPKVAVKKFKPSPGSEPGFLDAYPCPQPVPEKLLEYDVEGNVKLDSGNSKEGNRLHENHSNQPAMTHIDGKSTAGRSADADKYEKSPDTASSPTESQEAIEPRSNDRITEAAESTVTDSDLGLYQNYIKPADLHRRRTMEKNSGAMGNGAGAKRKAHAEKSSTTLRIAGRWNHRQGAIKPVVSIPARFQEDEISSPPHPTIDI